MNSNLRAVSKLANLNCDMPKTSFAICARFFEFVDLTLCTGTVYFILKVPLELNETRYQYMDDIGLSLPYQLISDTLPRHDWVVYVCTGMYFVYRITFFIFRNRQIIYHFNSVISFLSLTLAFCLSQCAYCASLYLNAMIEDRELDDMSQQLIFVAAFAIILAFQLHQKFLDTTVQNTIKF
jgi:hypothetical protein